MSPPEHLILNPAFSLHMRDTALLVRMSTPAEVALVANCFEMAPIPSSGRVADPSENILNTKVNILDDCSSNGAKYIPSRKGLKNLFIISSEKPHRSRKAVNVSVSGSINNSSILDVFT